MHDAYRKSIASLEAAIDHHVAISHHENTNIKIKAATSSRKMKLHCFKSKVNHTGANVEDLRSAAHAKDVLIVQKAEDLLECIIERCEICHS